MHLPVSVGRASRMWWEEEDLRMAAKSRSLMAMFEGIGKTAVDTPNLANANANATGQGRGVCYACRSSRVDCAMTHYGHVEALSMLLTSSAESLSSLLRTVCARMCHLHPLTRSFWR
jgi:hypothetical protein